MYIHENRIWNLRAVDSHVKFHLEFRTDSSSDSVSTTLPVIHAFVISMMHSLSQACYINNELHDFLGVQ